jgi:hypothetical protein
MTMVTYTIIRILFLDEKQTMDTNKASIIGRTKAAFIKEELRISTGAKASQIPILRDDDYAKLVDDETLATVERHPAVSPVDSFTNFGMCTVNNNF